MAQIYLNTQLNVVASWFNRAAAITVFIHLNGNVNSHCIAPRTITWKDRWRTTSKRY